MSSGIDAFTMTTTFASGMPENATTILPPNIQLERAISFRPFGMVIAFWTIFIGSIGNLLTILTFIANKKLRTTFNVFLLNLAIIDLWTAVGMLPFNLAGYMQMKWPFGNGSFTTRLQAYNYFCCGYSSIVFLVAITFNRFIGAMFPAKYKFYFSRDRMIGILLFCNLLSPVCLLPFLIGTDESCESPMQSLTGFHTIQFLCTFVCLPKGFWSGYMLFIRILYQFLPLVTMIVLYAAIFSVVHKRRSTLTMRMANSKSFNSGTDTNTMVTRDHSGRRKSHQEKRRNREDGRMLIISVVICVVFMITFLPSVMVNLHPESKKIDIRYHMAASNVTWFNASVNPIIYVLLNRRFRREYLRIIRMALGSIREKFIHESLSTGGDGSSRNSNFGAASEIDATARIRTDR